jgi:hypothetical protein
VGVGRKVLVTYVLLALLDGGIAVRVRDLGAFAEAGGDEAVDEAEDGDDAQGDANDGAEEGGSVNASGSRFRIRVPKWTKMLGWGGTCRTGLDDRGQ